MLNPFPIQFLSMLAYFILRVSIGLTFLILSKNHWQNRELLYSDLTSVFMPFGKVYTSLLILFELIISIMFILGFYTQLAALAIIFISLYMLLTSRKNRSPILPSKQSYFLFLAIGLSLFITGGGAFAFDLPI